MQINAAMINRKAPVARCQLGTLARILRVRNTNTTSTSPKRVALHNSGGLIAYAATGRPTQERLLGTSDHCAGSTTWQLMPVRLFIGKTTAISPQDTYRVVIERLYVAQRVCAHEVSVLLRKEAPRRAPLGSLAYAYLQTASNACFCSVAVGPYFSIMARTFFQSASVRVLDFSIRSMLRPRMIP